MTWEGLEQNKHTHKEVREIHFEICCNFNDTTHNECFFNFVLQKGFSDIYLKTKQVREVVTSENRKIGVDTT